MKNLLLLVLTFCLSITCINAQCSDFIWGPWSDLSCCSTTCGTGMAVRTRSCFTPNGVVANCSRCLGECAASFQNQPCNNNKPCPPAATCTASGDPHYTTFDKTYYTFQGDCNYTLISTCRPNMPVPFNVAAKNQKVGSVAVIANVSLQVPGYHIFIKCGCWDNPCVIIINGAVVTPIGSPAPILLYPPGVIINQPSVTNIEITTTFGLSLSLKPCSFTGKVDSSYLNKVCGLCGNYTNNAADDFTKSDGSITTDYLAFANSWKIADPLTKCTSRSLNLDTRIDPCNTTVLETAQRMCSPLLNNQGAIDIFMSCRCARIDPSIFYNRCIFDICQTGVDPRIACNQFSEFANQCTAAGRFVDGWEVASGCNQAPSTVAPSTTTTTTTTTRTTTTTTRPTSTTTRPTSTTTRPTSTTKTTAPTSRSTVLSITAKPTIVIPTA